MFTGLLTLPIAPVRGVVWLSEQVLDQATLEVNEPVAVYQRLAEIEEATAAGEISPQEAAEAEEQLVARLMWARAGGGQPEV